MSDFLTEKRRLDEAVREAREALARAVRITKTRAKLLQEAEEARFEYVRQHKADLESHYSQPTTAPKP